MKKSKVLLTLMCAVALVVTSVFGTLAYLTSQDAVVNTFTIGSVVITLDELDVDNDNNKGDNKIYTVNNVNVIRDKANAYHLMPGHEYVKDPIVHVNKISEDCYVFVKVENGIAAIESKAEGYKSIATQIADNGWKTLDGVANVFYQEYTKNENGANLEVFGNFKVAGDANTKEGWSTITAGNTKINVTAYAVQQDTFADAQAAWTATFGATAAPAN